MSMQEFRAKLLAKGSSSSSSSNSTSEQKTGMQAFREALLQKQPQDIVTKIYDEINRGYQDAQSGLNSGDTAATQSALARVHRNLEALRNYRGSLDLQSSEQLKKDVSDIQGSYQSLLQAYDGMKRRQAAESSPVFNRTSGTKTITPTAALPGQSTPGIRGVDTDYMSRRINMTAGAASGRDLSANETGELPEVEQVHPVAQWLKNVGVAGGASYLGDMTSGIAAGRSGNTAGKEFVSGALQTYIDQQEREKRFVEAYEAGDTSISKEDYEIAKEQIEFLQFYIDMYSAADEVEQDSGELTRGVANDLYTTADANLQSAMSGQKKVGQLLTQASVVGVQMLMDMALGGGLSAGTGMTAKQGAKAVMLGRTFGSGATAAANNGGDATAQIANGTLYAATAYLTEALSGGNPAYDTGSGLINKFAKSLGASKAVQLYLSSLPAQVFSEGLEEMLESVLNPLADRITTGAAYTLDPQQVISDGIIGMIVGAGGQTVSAAVRAAGSAVNNRTVGQAIIESGNVDALRDAAGMAGIELGDLSTPLEVGKAFRRVQDGFLNQAVQERVNQLGGQPDSVLGSAVIALSRDEGLSKDQRNAYYGSTAADQVIGELKSAAEGTRTTGNSWVWEAYVRPSELGDYRAVADGAAQETILPEVVSTTPESGTTAPETAQTAPEAAEVPASVEQISPVTETAQNIMERELAAVTNTQGMTDQEAMFHFGEEFRRITHSMYESAKGSETEQDAYIRLNRLMGEAAAQGGGDVKAIMAYLKGAMNHGNDLSDGAGRRDAGTGTGIEAGRMGSQPDNADTGVGRNGGTDRPGSVQTPWESAEALGIPRGTSEKIIRRVPEDAWTEGMKNAANEAAELGFSMTYVNGGIRVNNPVSGKVQQVSGVTYDESIVVQADHHAYSPEKIAQHEILHVRIAQNPGILQEAEDRLTDQFGAQEVYEMLRTYAQGYDFCYGVITEGMTADEIAALNRMYLEEMVCDAWAGLTRHFVRSSGRSITRYSDVVTDVVESLVGTGNGSGGMPGMRYLLERTVDNEPVVVAERDILDGVPETNWVKTVKDELRSKFPNGIKLHNEWIKINARSRAEFTKSKYTQWLERTSRQIYGDKFRAAHHADEILFAAKNWIGEGPSHIRQDNIREFARGDVLLKIGDRGYSADVVVGTTTDGSLLLYDIVNLTPTRIMLKDPTRPVAPPAKGFNNRTAISGPDERTSTRRTLTAAVTSAREDGGNAQPFDTSISDDAENSNSEFRGIPLKSRYPDLTEYDRYLTAQEKKRAGGMPGARYSLDEYSERQIENWSKSKKIVIYKNDQQVLDFVSRALTDKSYVGKMYFGIVSDELAEHIFNETGVEVTGRNVVLRANNIRKVQKKHGDEYKEGLQGQRAVTASDYVKIPDIISEADKIARSDYRETSGDMRPGVLFEKNYADGKVTVYAVDSGGSLELFVQTMYAQKNKESIANLIDEYSPIRTPEASVGTAPKNSISDDAENSNRNSRYSTDDATKSPEEMTAAELRKAVRDDVSMLRALDELEKKIGFSQDMVQERDKVKARLAAERAALEEKNRQFAAEKKDARERAKTRTVPTRAMADFRKEMLDIFSTQSGMRGELGRMVDRFAEETLSRGAVSYQDRAKLFDRLYESGAVTGEVDPYYQDVRNNIAGSRVYVDEETRHEFGDSESYTAFRREAFGAGVILTGENADNHIDGMYHELAEMYPGSFRAESGDTRAMLEEIVAMAKEGKAENVSLAEMMQRVEKDTGWSIEDQMDALERKVDAAIDKFIEKAELETDLKARSAVQQAKERQERRRSLERQSAARNMREMQQKTMKALQWLKKNERRMPERMKDQAQDLLDGLDLYAISIADEMRWSGKHQATWKDLADMYQNAKDHDPNFLPSPELEQIWARVNLKKVGELDLDALETLYRAASALRTEFYNRNNIIGDEEHRMFSEAYHDSVEEIRTSGGKGRLGTFFNAEQLTPVNVLQMMGGWRRKGQFFSFARMLERGERDYKGYVVDANRVLEEFIEEHQDWIKKADGQGKDAIWYEVEVPELLELYMGDKPIFGETKKVYMTPAQKVHLYLESMNYQNLRHMAGGRTFVNRALYEQGKRTEALAQGTTIRLAPETVKNLVADLTEEEMALAKVLQQYYNQFASERINAVSNPLYGYDKAVTRDYAPIFSNRNYTKTEPGVFDMTAEGVGHMKGREQYSKNPSYNISAFDAFERHVEQTARFVGYSIPVRNMNTLMNWRVQGSSMRDEITHVWGEEGAKYIENYIKKLQSPVFQEKTTLQKAAGKLLSNYISGVFAANPSVVLKQLLSYPMAGSVLGFSNMPTPVQITRTDSELIARYTPELEYRRMGYATPELAQLKDNPNWMQTNKVTRFIFGGAITWTDAGAARAIWPWAENYVRKNFPELETGTQEQIDAGQSPFYRKVAEVYNDAVTNTQSMADTSHRPVIMTHDDAITKAFTMFRSDSAQAYNTIRRLSGELARATKEGDTARARTARTGLAAGVSALVLSQLGGEAIDFLMALWKNKAKWYRDDEDELTAQSVGKEYLRGLIESISGLVLGGEQLTSFVLGLLNGEKWNFQDGIEVPGMEQLNDFLADIKTATAGMSDIVDGAFEVVKTGGDLGVYLKKNAGEARGIIKDTAISMAQYLGGIPTANIEKYLLGAVRWLWPEGAASYDSFFSTPDKSDLGNLKGKDLAAMVGDVLAIRDIRADDGTSAELARLYEVGQRVAVPGAVKDTFTVNGEDFTMNAAQLQEYERSYAESIGAELDALVESDAYIEADDETRGKMLERLYTYAADNAKRAVAPEYKGDTWTMKAKEAESDGVPVSAYAALQAQGLDKTAEKISYIDGMNLTDDQKGAMYYHAVASDSRKEDVDAMMDAGMSWGDMYETMKEYMDIDAMEGATASEKAATFKTWAYDNLNHAQTQAAVENLTFSTGMKASTATYDKLMDSGLSADDALAVTTAWGKLEPEAGRDTVSDLQKMNAVVETLQSPAAQMSALSSILDDAGRWKLSRAASADLTAKDYVEFKTILEEYKSYDPEGSANSLSQAECTAALKSMGWLNLNQKAVLWQLQMMAKDGKSNPFSTLVGLDVYNGYMDWKESGEEVEVESTEDTEPVQMMGYYPGLQLPVLSP